MTSLKAGLNWLLRRGLLYLLLVAVFAVSPFLLNAWRAADGAKGRYTTLEGVHRSLAADMAALQGEFDRERDAARQASSAALQSRIDRTAAELAKERADPPGNNFALMLRGGADGIRANETRKLRIVVLQRELEALQRAQDLARARERPEQLRQAYAHARPACLAAIEALRVYEATWLGRMNTWVDSNEHKAIVQRRTEICEPANRALRAWRDRSALDAARRKAEADFAATGAGLGTDLTRALQPLQDATQDASTAWRGTLPQKLRLWAEEWHLKDVLWGAFKALLLIVAMPYLIRLLFWFVFARIAERRPAIRLSVPGGAGRAIAPVERSSTSVAVRLGSGEELLVRQDYLQTTSHTGSKATRWLLDWHHPLSSIATGLTFLTRIGGEGEVTTVSAVRDPFAEVTVLDLPEGTSCVLQPRALAAVAQPVARPLRITSHWRLFSLNAWLTLQLRYLVFHGPCRLVVKGGRGVRVEKAERGRVFGQAQLVGFSADLAYSVTRTETFWPYFLGREQLFKDKVEAGEGVLVIEEAPLAGRGRGESRKGLEGAFDVMTKAFGM